jgi:hypothetical protein
MIFGSFRQKVSFDLIIRQHYAFPILDAAEKAVRHGLPGITVIEFGVAHGAGLLNMCKIAERVARVTGVEVNVVGFDTATGMPPPIDYRDHPERFQEGDFAMMDRERLQKALPPFARLILGDIRDTAAPFLESVTPDAPISFVAIDVDYYSSAKSALEVLRGSPDKYLSTVSVHLDDIDGEFTNPWCGELLAVAEFNAENDLRKIAPCDMLETRRIFKHPKWIKKAFTAHILDHVYRSTSRVEGYQPVDSKRDLGL